MKTLSRRLRKLEERFAPKVDAEGRTPADVLQERFRHRLEEESGEAPEDQDCKACSKAVEARSTFCGCASEMSEQTLPSPRERARQRTLSLP